MPTTVTKTVKASGGDYSSLAAWEAGQQADLTASDTVQVAECYAFLDTVGCLIDGWTTDATRYAYVYVPPSQRHNGRRSSSAYRLEASNAFDFSLNALQAYTRINGVQVKNTDADAGGGVQLGATSGTQLCVNTIVYDTAGFAGCFRMIDNGGVTTFYLNNCLVLNAANTGNGAEGFRCHGGAAAYLYNCAAVNIAVYAFRHFLGASAVAKNCYAHGVTAGFQGTWTLTTCHASDASGNTQTAFSTSSGAKFYAVTAGSEDLRVHVGSALIDAGTDLSADAGWRNPDGNVGIAGTLRPQGAAWDVGVFEFALEVELFDPGALYYGGFAAAAAEQPFGPDVAALYYQPWVGGALTSRSITDTFLTMSATLARAVRRMLADTALSSSSTLSMRAARLLADSLITAGPSALVYLNGLVKDYNPPGGIDAAGTIQFDPTAQNWQAGKAFACPQGFGLADTWDSATAHLLGSPSDSGVPITGTDRGTWVSGTAYSKYDKAVDAVDGLQYVTRVAIGSSTTRPGLSSSWNLATWNGFSPRSLDAGYYGSVQRVGDATRWFSCEIHALANSGSTEPVISGTGSGADGDLYWTRITAAAYRGAWAASTAYANNDYILVDGSLWRCVGGGTSGGSAPNWTPTLYGSTIADGPDIIWQRRYVYQGVWAANTQYGYRVVNNHADVRNDGVVLSDGSILFVQAIKGTDGTTGGTEPAWSTASSTLTFWADGDMIWRFGTFAVNDPTLQNERLVLSGLATPAADGKVVTIANVAPSSTGRDVVLADRFVLDRAGVQNLPGTDKASAHPFDFGGSNIRLAEGQSVSLRYSASTGLWTQTTAPVADVLALRVGRVLADSVLSESDALTRALVRVLADNGLVFSAALVSARTRMLADNALSMSDSVAVAVSHVFVRSLTDTILTISDSLASRRARALTDTGAAISDTLTSARLRLLSDSLLVLSDALVPRPGRTITDTAMTLSEVLASNRLRALSDNALVLSDTLARRATRFLADNGLTMTDLLAVRPGRALTDTALTMTEALASLRNRALTDTGLAMSAALASSRNRALTDTALALSETLTRPLVRRLLADTGLAVSDSLALLVGRAMADTAFTMSDSVKVTLPPRLITDTALTMSDTLVRSAVGRALSDNGVVISDSAAARITRQLTATALALTDQIARSIPRAVTDTALVMSDALAPRVTRVLADNGLTISDTAAARVSRVLTATALVMSDSLTPQFGRARFATDTALAMSDVLDVPNVKRVLQDTGLVISDAVAHAVTRMLVSQGLTMSDSMVVQFGRARFATDTFLSMADVLDLSRVSHNLTDAGLSQTDVLSHQAQRKLTDTALVMSDALVRQAALARLIADTALNLTEDVEVSAVLHHLSDTLLDFSESLAIGKPVQKLTDTLLTMTDSVTRSRLVHVALADRVLTMTDSLVSAITPLLRGPFDARIRPLTAFAEIISDFVEAILGPRTTGVEVVSDDGEATVVPEQSDAEVTLR